MSLYLLTSTNNNTSSHRRSELLYTASVLIWSPSLWKHRHTRFDRISVQLWAGMWKTVFCVCEVFLKWHVGASVRCLHKHLLMDMWSRMTPWSSGSWRRTTSGENVPGCLYGIWSLITAGNRCHSWQSDRTVSYFSYRKHRLIIQPFLSSSLLLSSPVFLPPQIKWFSFVSF